LDSGGMDSGQMLHKEGFTNVAVVFGSTIK
jgi:hypothetical protein